jgi:hypothetical protein
MKARSRNGARKKTIFSKRMSIKARKASKVLPGMDLQRPSHGGKHKLDGEIRYEVQRVEARAVAWAAFSGALSAGSSGLVEFWIAGRIQEDDEADDHPIFQFVPREVFLYIVPVVIVFSIIEILIMYVGAFGFNLD